MAAFGALFLSFVPSFIFSFLTWHLSPNVWNEIDLSARTRGRAAAKYLRRRDWRRPGKKHGKSGKILKISGSWNLKILTFPRTASRSSGLLRRPNFCPRQRDKSGLGVAQLSPSCPHCQVAYRPKMNDGGKIQNGFFLSSGQKVENSITLQSEAQFPKSQTHKRKEK